MREVGTGISVLIGLFALLGLAACGGADAPGDGDAADTAVDTARSAAPGAGVAGLTAVDPWVRVAIRPEGSDAPDAPPVNSAAYLVLRNAGGAADAIVSVETAIADTVELHTVSMEEGVMRMRPVDSVVVGAGGEAVLEPGGYHIMLIGIREALEEGDTVPLRIRLRSGATLDVMAPVLRSPPI